MSTTAETSAPAPQLAAAARIVERDDGCLQIGIRPESSIRVSDSPAARQALEDIAHGERCAEEGAALLAALDDVGLFTTPQPPGPFPVRVIGSIEGDLRASLRRSGLRPRARARLALVVNVGEFDRSRLDPLIRTDVPHLILRVLDGVLVVGPFVVPGETACLRCLDAHHTDEDPGYPIALKHYIAASTQVRDDGCLDAPDASSLALALAWVARDLRTFATGGIPTTWSSTVVIGGSDSQIEAVAWQAHPQCGCRWLEPALFVS